MTNLTGTTDNRAWGSYTVLADENTYKAKSIIVNPGARLSYQRHQKRAEHWYVVSGDALVILDDVEYPLKAGESIDIPLGAKHRMCNPGTEPVVFIEVQVGTYFGEDDIERLEDDFNREGTVPDARGESYSA